MNIEQQQEISGGFLLGLIAALATVFVGVSAYKMITSDNGEINLPKALGGSVKWSENKTGNTKMIAPLGYVY